MTTNQKGVQMTKEKWYEHMQETGLVRPSQGGDKDAWNDAVREHLANRCPSCLDRAKTRRRTKNARITRHVMADLGMHRVIGSVSGSVYYE